MKAIFNKKRVIKFLLYLIAILMLFVGMAYFTIPSILKENGISYASYDFDFPASISVNQLYIQNPDIEIAIDHFEVDWHWSSLLRKNINGKLIKIENAHILLKENELSTGENEEIDIPTIVYDYILLRNINVENEKGDLKLFIPGLSISNLNFNKQLAIDKIKGDTIFLSYDYHNDEETVDEHDNEKKDIIIGKEESFSFSDLPAINIGEFKLNNSKIAISSDSQSHDFSNFYLTVNHLSTEKLVNLSVDQFSFMYQDSLHFDLKIIEGETKENNRSKLNGLAISLPGLNVNIPTLEFSQKPATEVTVNFAKSYVDTDLIKIFLPDKSVLPEENIKIHFNGKVGYTKSKISIEDFSIQGPGSSNIIASGYMNMEAPGNEFKLEVKRFQTSTSDINQLLGNRDDKKNITIGGQFEVSEINQILMIKGETSINKSPGNFNLVFNHHDSLYDHFNGSIKMPDINVSALTTSAPENTRITNLELVTSITLSKNQIIKNIDFNLQGDSLFIKDYQLVQPTIITKSDGQQSSFQLFSLTRDLDIYVETNDDINNFQNLSYAGHIIADLPKTTHWSSKSGKLFAKFDGYHFYSNTEKSLLLEIDSIHFVPASANQPYITKGQVAFNESKNGDLALDVVFDEKKIIEFKANDEFIPWIAQDEFWMNAYPEASLSVNGHLDSLIIDNFTGIKGSLDLEKFMIDVGEDGIASTIKMNQLTYEGFVLNDISSSIEFSPENYNGILSMHNFISPYITLNETSFKLFPDKDSLTTIYLDTFIPQIKESIALAVNFKTINDGMEIKLNEDYAIKLGNQTWSLVENDGIFINTGSKDVKSKFSMANEDQKLAIHSLNNTLDIALDQIKIAPILSLFAEDLKIDGELSLNTKVDMEKQAVDWSGNLQNLKVDTIMVGEIVTDGIFSQDQISAGISLTNDYSTSSLNIEKNDGPLNFGLSLHEFNIGKFNGILNGENQNYHLEGILSGDLQGKYVEQLDLDGLIIFQDVIASLPEYGFYVKLARDSVLVKNNRITFPHFIVEDQNNEQLLIEGHIDLTDNPEVDIQISANNYAILQQDDVDSDLWGHLNLDTSLKVAGKIFDELGISGYINTLPDANLGIKYKSEVSLDEREQVINFINLDDDNKQAEVKKDNLGIPINWDVNVSLGTTEIYVLIYENSTDYIKLVAAGDINLKKGLGQEPLIFGEISSTEGNVYYEAPMVSNLNLNINKAAMKWTGDLRNPRITFRGSELFRVSLNEISAQWENSRDRVPVTVLTNIDNHLLENFDIGFDLSSSNGQVGNYLQTLPQNTREKYAINLLVFGKIDVGADTGGSTLASGVVSKLNEISRRNIKNADLSFYVDGQAADQTHSTETIDKFGYSFSKGFMKKKFKVSVGGNINFSQYAPSSSKKFNPFGNLQLTYILSEEPYITIDAARNDVYRGAIDGQIDEASLGISYQKHFRNFFKLFRMKKAE